VRKTIRGQRYNYKIFPTEKMAKMSIFTQNAAYFWQKIVFEKNANFCGIINENRQKM
jgi:hypothetical protein